MAREVLEATALEDGAADGSHVAVLERGERRIHIVGTAHVSRRSVSEVERTIEELRPDTVCVELCALRYEALRAGGQYAPAGSGRHTTLDLPALVRRGDPPYVLASLIIQGYQRRLGKAFGVRPGAELLAAAQKALDVGAELVLADRDIRATLRRVWANLPWRSRLMVGISLIAVSLDRQEVSEEQIEAFKNRKYVGDRMNELARVIPGLKRPLIDERDQYLMSAIEDAPGRTVVAVVGAGHVEGMVALAGRKADREALSAIPKKRIAVELRRYVVPALALAAVVYGIVRGADALAVVCALVIPTATAALASVLFAGGTIASALAGALAAPLTALCPPLDAGRVAGGVEARLRKPTDAERQRLSEDAMAYKTLRKNPVARVLLVAVLARFGARLGAFSSAIALWVTVA